MISSNTQEKPVRTAALAAEPRNLYLISLLLVGVITFFFYFSMTGVPLQGGDLELLVLPRYLHKPISSAALQQELPNAPAARAVLTFLWSLSDGSAKNLRLFCLVLHVLSALYFFGIVRRWTGKPTSVIPPLLGGFLFCVLPTVPPLLAGASGLSQLLGTFFALICANSYLAVTEDPDRRRPLHLFATLAFALLAAVSYYGLIALPLVLLLLDATRLEKHRETRMSPDWIMLFSVTGVLAVLGIVVCFSDSFSFRRLYIPYHLLFMVCILFLIRTLLLFRSKILKNILLVLLNLLLIASAVISFQQTMAFWEPLSRIEKTDAPDKIMRGALQCIALAEKEDIPAERIDQLRQAATLWKTSPPDLSGEGIYKLAFARVLEETNAPDEALAHYAELREHFSFTENGLEGAAGMARLQEPGENASFILELLESISRHRDLSQAEELQSALTHMRLGDARNAALHFSRLSGLHPQSPEGQLREQSLKIRSTIDALAEESQKKIEADAKSMEGFVSLAESHLLAGNHLQAFYWLEFALRRDSSVPKAWELLGVLSAMKGAEKNFVEKWGALKAADDKAWIDLAHKSAFSQAWDAAFVYLNQPGKSPDFSAEELMAVFSLEQKRLDQAESWFLKAAELMPDSFRPRLFLADLALVRQDKEKAEEWLKAARDLQAPQAELDRRETVLKTGLPAPNAVPDSGVPVPALPASPNTGASPGVPMRTLIE